MTNPLLFPIYGSPHAWIKVGTELSGNYRKQINVDVVKELPQLWVKVFLLTPKHKIKIRMLKVKKENLICIVILNISNMMFS